VVEGVVRVVLGLDLGESPVDLIAVPHRAGDVLRFYRDFAAEAPDELVDLEVTVDTTTLYRVYLGQAELGGAIRAGQLTMSGPRTLQRGFGHWFTWSAFAPASRSAQERRTAASRLASPHRVRIAEGGDPATAPQWP
jgi:hypothetical protein